MSPARPPRSFLVLAAAVLLPSAQAILAGPEPYLVVTINSADRLLSAARYLTAAGGSPQMATMVDSFLQGVTQGKGLAGIDRGKPLGLYNAIRPNGEQQLVIFAPVADSKSFLEVLRLFFPSQTPTAAGLTFLEGQGRQAFCKFSRDYCFLSLTPQALEGAALPSGSGGRYDIGVDLNFSQISTDLRALLAQQLEQQLRSNWNSMKRPANASEAAGRELGKKLVLAALKRLTEDADRASMGLRVNPSAGQVELEWEVAARRGTPLAAQLTGLGRTSPVFAGLSSGDAPLCMVVGAPLSGEFRDSFVDAIRRGIDDPEGQPEPPALAGTPSRRPSAAAGIDALQKVFGGLNRLDLAVVLSSSPAGKLQVLLAGKVASGAELQKLIEQVPAEGDRSGGVKEVRLDVEKTGGARIHSLRLHGRPPSAISSDTVHLAIRGDSVFVAAGDDTLSAVKSALRQTGSAAPPISSVFCRVKPGVLIDLLGAAGNSRAQLARQALQGKGDYVACEVLPVDQGVKARLTLGEGILRLVVAGAGAAPAAYRR